MPKPTLPQVQDALNALGVKCADADAKAYSASVDADAAINAANAAYNAAFASQSAASAALAAYHKAMNMIVAFMAPEPPVVVEPPPVIPPVVQPPVTMPKHYGVALGAQLKPLNPGLFGDGPDAKALKAALESAGQLTLSSVSHTAQACVATPMSSSYPPIMLQDVALILGDGVGANGVKTGKGWGSRFYGAPMLYERVTVTGAGKKLHGHAEGHPVYDNGRDWWSLIGCLFVECPGNAQVTCRPSEAPGILSDIAVDSKWLDCHAPLENGNRSAMAGPLLALYNAGADCNAQVKMRVEQRKWAQFGPFVTCVPAMSAMEQSGQSKPWWTPGQHTHRKLSVELDADVLWPAANEVLRVAALRELSLKGTVRLLSVNGASELRIMIDDPIHANPAHCESVLIDLDVRYPNGTPCPVRIERGGKLVAMTTEGVYQG